MKKVVSMIFILALAASASSEDDHAAILTKDGRVVHWAFYYRDAEDNFCTNMAGGVVCIPKADVEKIVTGSDARKIEKTVRQWEDREFYSPLEQAPDSGGTGREVSGGREASVENRRGQSGQQGSGGMMSRAKGAVEKANERMDRTAE